MALVYAEDEINTFLGEWTHEWEKVYKGDPWAIVRRDWNNVIDENVWTLQPKVGTRGEKDAWTGPRYTQDLASIARVEAELDRLDKKGDYILVLLDVLDLREHEPISTLAAVATASPRHRAEAAYRVLKRLY
jgi:hypothetical protein